MGEAKRKAELAKLDAEATILPEEIEPLGDNVLLRPLRLAERFRGSRLYLPHDIAVALKDKSDPIKKQFGTILAQPRCRVIACGPDVQKFKPGDEAVPHRKAVAFDGTAMDIPGFGVYFMAEEKQLVGKINRLPDDQARELLAKHAAERAEEAAKVHAALKGELPDEINLGDEEDEDGPEIVIAKS